MNIDFFTLSRARRLVEKKVIEAGGMTPSSIEAIVKENIGPQVTAYLPEYFGEETKAKELGLATLKNALAHINVTFLGVDNTGKKDNADLLQNIIDSVPNGTTLYFPAGEYLLSHGITVDKSLQLLGDRKGKYLSRTDNAKIHGSCLKFMDSVSDDTMIVQGDNCWSLTMHNLMLCGNSGAFYDDGLNDEVIPYAQYRYEVARENVNGVLCIHSTDITDCTFNSFSGYGLSSSQAQNINQCKFFGNGIGVYVAYNDIMLRDCYITAGKTGIYCPGTKNIMVFDCFIDQMAEYAIYCESWLGGYINCWIDHINYSGIHANVINNLNLVAKIHRSGMYYSGKTFDELKVSDSAASELENFSKASAISCSKIYKSTLELGAITKANDDAGTSSKSSPVIAVYITQADTSVLIGADIKAYVRAFTTADALTFISNKGVIRYSYGMERITPSIVIQAYSPTASSKAQNVGDRWYNRYKKEWYIATAITDSATTWERQYTTTEIADIITRLEVLENATTTTE